ncbi:MAG: Glu-tRNA(Gln) amidotransferase subunit GatE [Candidatus Aenigmatarchaeota archaeon]
MIPTDYEQVGFKCGIEIHNRLATKHKLFCNCSPRFSTARSIATVKRNLRAVAGELGTKDATAVFEYLRNRTFFYEKYPQETCLVEEDEEPPHEVNREALEVVLQVAKFLRAEIPDEIQFMRKTVVDGSNTAGFQRTAIVGMNGRLETSKGIVRVANISLEEESAGIVSHEDGNIVYRLDRLGIPLIEIGTEADVKDPEHAREVAEKLGMIVRSTGKSQRGIGVTRQDLNVSVRGGARVEVKGFQELDMIPKVLDGEVQRQLELLKEGKQVEEETRQAQPDGTTKFMRPLPGGERMYPETDVPTIPITKEMLAKINIPENWEQKLERLKQSLPADLAEQVLKSEYLELFERLSKNYEPMLVATMLVSTLKDLRRRGIAVDKLSDNHIEGVMQAIKMGKTAKESVPKLLEVLAGKPSLTAGEAITELGAGALTEHELREIVKKTFEKFPDLVRDNKQGALMGEVMKAVRGRIDGGTVAKVLKEMLGQ